MLGPNSEFNLRPGLLYTQLEFTLTLSVRYVLIPVLHDPVRLYKQFYTGVILRFFMDLSLNISVAITRRLLLELIWYPVSFSPVWIMEYRAHVFS